MTMIWFTKISNVNRYGFGASVNVCIDTLLICAVDLIMVVSGKNENDARECLREMKSKTWVCERDAIDLVKVIPGIAEELRVQVEDIIKSEMEDIKSTRDFVDRIEMIEYEYEQRERELSKFVCK